jgi:hypothetical protein
MVDSASPSLDGIRGLSRLASFRFGVLCLGAGLVLSGHFGLYALMSGGEVWEGFMAPLRHHTTWAQGDDAIRSFVIGVVSLGLSIVPLEITWRRWANARRVGLAPPLASLLLLGVALVGLLGLLRPLVPISLLRWC